LKTKSHIQFHYTKDPFELNERKLKQWIQLITGHYNKKIGELNFIFCDDEYLRKLNKKFLNHDYYTDILSFPGSPDPVEGECYISIDRVRDNAQKYEVDFEWELLRVIIHGILHFLGYSDKTLAKKKEMRRKEEEALAFYKAEFINDDHYFDRVYDIVRCIPKGRVSSYGAIADYLTLGSARMVGWALNQLKGNASDIPAHRVVNAKGELTGRMMFGDNGERMGKLLRKEKVPVKNHKVENLEKYFWNPAKEI
jgi:probable rRNA maturation factor